jgi:ABC-type amino acid transport substrate-binding protein
MCVLRTAALVALALTLAPVRRAVAQDTAPPARTLIIGTKVAPPFAIKDADGHWSGISIDLWRAVARDMGYRFVLRDTTLDGLLNGVADGSLDAAVAALTITADREQRFDFTEPFYVAGLGIAVPTTEHSSWLTIVSRLLSSRFLKVAIGLTLLLLIGAMLVWLFEHRRNPEQFGGGVARGIGASIWWSAETMTTVGYGDKVPRTIGGRLVSMIWMLAGIIVITSFTAVVTSSLTLEELQGPVQGPDDLESARVGTIASSTSSAYLTSHHIPFRAFATPLDALHALEHRQLDAVVYDAPILGYEITNHFHGMLHVLPTTFDQQYYGIALPAGSPLREPLNRALLARITAPAWQAVLARYLGR